MPAVEMLESADRQAYPVAQRAWADSASFESAVRIARAEAGASAAEGSRLGEASALPEDTLAPDTSPDRVEEQHVLSARTGV